MIAAVQYAVGSPLDIERRMPLNEGIKIENSTPYCSIVVWRDVDVTVFT